MGNICMALQRAHIQTRRALQDSRAGVAQGWRSGTGKLALNGLLYHRIDTKHAYTQQGKGAGHSHYCYLSHAESTAAWHGTLRHDWFSVF